MDVKGFLQVFKDRLDYDFCNYSVNSISRRLEKISQENNMTLEEILDKSVEDKEFRARVIEDITVNTTELFRDPIVWINLYKTLYKNLPKQKVNFWHLGCSIGLEVYSNIILLNELGILDRVRVIGTDLNERVLAVGRKGEYTNQFYFYFRENFDEVMKGIGSSSRFEDYFDIVSPEKLRIKPQFLKVPQFIKQNMVQDKAPFPYKIDVVFIRNVMIYFNATLQTKIMQMIKSKMFDNACIIFGKQELLPDSNKLSFESKGYYYKRVELKHDDDDDEDE